MNLGVDQNHTLVFSTFCLSFLVDYLYQGTEEVVEWQGHTITQILAAASKFSDRLETKKLRTTVLAAQL